MSDEPAGSNDAQAAYWEHRSSSWIASSRWWLGYVAGPLGRAAMDALAPVPGDRVLDIGCGTGPTTIDLGRAVGPDGTVLGVDISPSMVDEARAQAAAAGVGNVEFAVADVQVADLGVGSFDGAFSQFGVMFFADPAAAFANVRRMLRPDGGRVAFCCWRDLFENEWMFVPGAAAMSVTGAALPLPGPGEPGPFSFKEPDHVRDVLERAGFGGIEIDRVDATVVVPEDRIDDMIVGVSRMGAVREQLDVSPERRGEIVDAVRAELQSRVDGGSVELGSAAWAVSALA